MTGREAESVIKILGKLRKSDLIAISITKGKTNAVSGVSSRGTASPYNHRERALPLILILKHQLHAFKPVAFLSNVYCQKKRKKKEGKIEN